MSFREREREIRGLIVARKTSRNLLRIHIVHAQKQPLEVALEPYERGRAHPAQVATALA